MDKLISALVALFALFQVGVAIEPAYLTHLEVKTNNDWNSGILSTFRLTIFHNPSDSTNFSIGLALRISYIFAFV
jgi:hypothetical protein